MFAGTLDDTAAATGEVRIHRNDQPLVRESEEEATTVVERRTSADESCSIASALVPGYGTE